MKKFYIILFVILLLSFLFYLQYQPKIIKEEKLWAIVTGVTDGDTITVESGQRVRLLGIDAPEKGEAFYKESKKFLEELILYKEVRLEKDVTNKDRYNRLLRWVWLDNELINAVVVREGLAIAKFYEDNEKYQKLIAEAEKEAMKNKKGLWKK